MRTFRTISLAALVPFVAIGLFSTPADLAPPDLDTSIETLQARLADLERDNAILRAHLEAAVRDGERTAAAVDDAFAWLAEQQARIDEDLSTIATRDDRPPAARSLGLRLDALEDLLAHVRRDGNDLYLEGANLHIRNGAGATDTTNGSGNLIVGYNESRPEGDRRAGSHVLVLGAENDFDGYGGIVAGRGNAAGGAYATVLGGTGNRAEGTAAVVVGGAANEAHGDGAVVSGGGFNVATGRYAVVGGGMQNEARGDASVAGRGCATTVATCGGD